MVAKSVPKLTWIHSFNNFSLSDCFKPTHGMYLFLNFYWSTAALNVVLVSTVQQNESLIHIHIYPFF